MNNYITNLQLRETMEIKEDKIRADYASVANFCREEHIGMGVYNGLKMKKTLSFASGSASYKAYKKLVSKGYIEEQK